MADTDVAQPLVTRNRLLGRLPENEMVRLTPLFERIEITPRQILHHWSRWMDITKDDRNPRHAVRPDQPNFAPFPIAGLRHD